MKKMRVPAMIPLCLAAMVSRECLAMGLGEAQLDSRLGSPLEARVPIKGAEGLAGDQLLVKVMPVWDEQSDSAIGGLDPRIITVSSEINESGSGVIYLRSSSPIVEPFLNFVLTVRWPMGTINREYTLLLDLPSTLASFQALPAPGLRQAPPSTDTVAKKAPVSVRPRPAASEITADSERYFTRRGDSLWRIAARLRRARGGDQLQLMEQIFTLNPRAFVRGARDMLKESVTLNIAAGALAGENVVDDGAGEAPVVEPKNRSELDAGQPGQAALPVAKALRRDEENVSPQGGDEVAELTASLLAVSDEVADVTANIDVMSQRLEVLQARLSELQQRYEAINRAPENVSPQVADEWLDPEVNDLAPAPSADDMTPLFNGVKEELPVVVADEPTTSSASAATPPPASAAPSDTVPTDAAVDNASPTTASGEWRGNPWWLLLAVVLAVVAAVKRQRGKNHVGGQSAAPEKDRPVDQGAHPAGAHFDDVFDELDGGLRPGVAKSASVAEEGAADLAQQAGLGDAPAPQLHATERAAMSGNMVDVAPVKTFEQFSDLGANDDTGLSADDGDDDVQTAAAACLAMADYSGAQRILESALEHSESSALRLMLLDVYAQQGDEAEFETLALQMEFAGASDDDFREIAVLRKAMEARGAGHDSAGER